MSPAAPLEPAILATITAAVERIIPSDDGLPGAREAGTINFVVSELDGAAPRVAALVELALTLDEAAAEASEDSAEGPTGPAGPGAFAALAGEQQDAILLAVETDGSPALAWLVEVTMEGFYGDPRHGGNANGVSWEALGFPGPTGGSGYAPPFGWYDANEPNLPGLGPDGTTEPTRPAR